MSSLRAALLLSLLANPLVSQTITGTLAGTVKDPHGAGVPGATVTVTSNETAQKRSATTNNDGRYTITFLPPGSYNLTATAKGFGKASDTRIKLDVAQAAELDLSLPLDVNREVVEVNADAPLLTVDSSNMETVVENKLIENLPSGERSTLSFINLVPGVIDAGFALAQGENLNTNGNAQGPIGTPGNRNFFDSNFSAGGGQVSTNDVLIDGVSDTVGDFNGIAISPPQDSVREFKVVSGAVPAEYGRTGSSVVSFVTKSGTDKFHGALYDYFQNGDLNANGWQRNRRGLNPDGTAVLPRIPVKRNQFGAAVGGPVEIPKLGKAKQTFFFFNYEGRREANPFSAVLTMPTAKMRTGDLSELLTGAVRPGLTNIDGTPALFGQIYDPYAPLVGGKRQPIPGNRLDLLPKCPATGARTSACLDPVALKFMTYLPLPNQPGLTNNYVFSGTSAFARDLYAARIDRNLNDRHSFFGRFTTENRHQSDPNFLDSIASNARTIHDTFYNATFNEVWIVSPSIVNNIRYGYTRAHAHQVLISEGTDPAATLGLPSYIAQAGPVAAFPIFNFSSAGAQNSGLPGEITSGEISGGGNNQPRDTQTVADSLTWIRGRHTLKLGGEYRLYRFFAFQYGNPDGTFTFSRTFTIGPSPTATVANAQETGSSLATLLMGLPGSISKETDIPLTLYHHYGAAYVQDDFKLSSRITANLGLRWDLETPTGESHQQVATLDTTQPSILSGKVGAPTDAAVLALRGNYSSLPGLLTFPQGAQARIHLDRFAPRLGLAIRLTNKMSIRAGYSLFYVPVSVEQSTAIGSVFTTSVSQTTGSAQVIAPGGTATPSVFLSNPFPGGIPTAPGNTQGASTGLGGSITIVLPDQPNPYVQQWNLVLERNLGGNFVLDLAYVGMRGEHLPAASLNLNQLPGSYVDYAQANYTKYGVTSASAFFSAQVPNPFFGLITNSSSSLRNATVTRAQLLTPYPMYTGITLYRPNIGEARYNALQVIMQKRFSRGLSATASYVWSKAMDTGGPGNNSGNGTSVEDIYNIRLDKSISNLDVPHRVVASGVWEMPFFRHSSLRLMRSVLGGWQTAGTYIWQRGTPITITYASNPLSAVGFAVTQPNRVPGSVAGYDVGTAEQNARDGKPWFNTVAYTVPATYTIGNAARNYSDLRRDNYRNVNLSMARNFTINERWRAQLRGEFINAFNQVVFGTPGREVTTPSTFGIITTQGNTPRTVQLVLRLTF
jgi:hypothetical protein